VKPEIYFGWQKLPKLPSSDDGSGGDDGGEEGGEGGGSKHVADSCSLF
jgi:hypothetical protein